MGKLTPTNIQPEEISSFSDYRHHAKLGACYLTKEAPRDQVTRTANAIIGLNLETAISIKPDLNSYQECTKAVADYFQRLADYNIRPSITGVAMALGLTRLNFLQACQTGTYHDARSNREILLPSEVQNLFIALKENYTAMLESFLESGLVHPASGIFLLKNNGEYKDVVERNYTVTKTTIELSDMAKKYNLADD